METTLEQEEKGRRASVLPPAPQQEEPCTNTQHPTGKIARVRRFSSLMNSGMPSSARAAGNSIGADDRCRSESLLPRGFHYSSINIDQPTGAGEMAVDAKESFIYVIGRFAKVMSALKRIFFPSSTVVTTERASSHRSLPPAPARRTSYFLASPINRLDEPLLSYSESLFMVSTYVDDNDKVVQWVDV